MSNIYCGDRYDDAIHEAMLRLNKAQNAYYAYDNANESYMRLRSRAESGRISKYNTKLGVRVDVSLDGCGDDILADVVDRGNEALALKTVWQSAVMDVRDLILKSVDVDSREFSALEARFLKFPSLPFSKIMHPAIKSKSMAQRAYETGVAKVAEYVLEHPAVVA